jgi:hypothetical protein
MNKKFKHLLICAALALPATKAQQPTTAFNVRALVRPGMSIGGHLFSEDAAIENTAINDRGDIAFVASLIESNQKRTFVFSSSRKVAGDGDVIDGKVIDRIVGTTVAINNVGQTAYEAFYKDNAAPSAEAGLGAFIDNRFVLPLKFSNSSADPDFTLTEDGKILPRAGFIPPETPAPKKKGSILNHLPVSVSDAVGQTVAKGSHGVIKPGKPTPAPAPPAQAQKTAAAPVSATHATCTAPPGVFPKEWTDPAGGPVASQVFEPSAKGRAYDSAYAGHFDAPFRIVHFAASCKILLLSVGDPSLGVIEVWARNGLLTYLKLDRTYQFGYLAEKVKSDSFVRDDSALRINRRNEVLLQVNLSPRGSALLLATPNQ